MDSTSGLFELTNYHFQLQPNPLTDISVVTYTGETDNIHMSIVSLNGEEVRKIVVQSTETKIKKDNLNPGIYFLKVYKLGSLKGVLKILVL
jgi:hypothetical protein